MGIPAEDDGDRGMAKDDAWAQDDLATVRRGSREMAAVMIPEEGREWPRGMCRQGMEMIVFRSQDPKWRRYELGDLMIPALNSIRIYEKDKKVLHGPLSLLCC